MHHLLPETTQSREERQREVVKVQKSELGKTTFQVEVKIKANRTKGDFTNRPVLEKKKG